MKVRPRQHESTSVIGRAFFEDPPPDVESPADLRRWERFRAAYRDAAALTAIPDFPLQIDFELTRSCQLRCAFCASWQGPDELSRPAPRRMPFDIYAAAIREGEEHGLVSVKLNANYESLTMGTALAEYVRFARSHGVLNTYLATNGIGLTENVADVLIESGLTKVMVSIDAMTPVTYRRIRGADRLRLVERNVIRLLALRDARGSRTPLIRVNLLRTPLNEHEADRFVDYWASRVDAVGIQERLGIPGIESNFDAETVAERRDFRCAFPWKLVAIGSDGSIWPCCTFSGHLLALGNIRDTTIAEAWRSVAAVRLRESSDDPVCQHCVGSENGNGS